VDLPSPLRYPLGEEPPGSLPVLMVPGLREQQYCRSLKSLAGRSGPLSSSLSVMVLGGLVVVAQACLIWGHTFERRWTGKTVLICQRCGRQVEPQP
jgi:hypothetical protein